MAANNKMICARCGVEMNHHADKIDYGAALENPGAESGDSEGVLQEILNCPGCGNVEMRPASSPAS
jgi:ribosomal protein S27AE